jgi:hypothetical protein
MATKPAKDATGASFDMSFTNVGGEWYKNVILHDASGNAITPASYAEDIAHTTGDQLVPSGAVRRDAKTAGAGTDGDYTNLSVNAAGDLRVDGGQAFIVRVSPTVTAGAYTANDTLGGEQTIAAAARISGGGGVLTSIRMIAQDDSANLWVANDVKVLIFQSNPAGTYTDNVALDSTSLTDSDAQTLLLGAFSLDTLVTLGNVIQLSASNINMPYVCSGSADLFAVAINVGGRTPDAAAGVTFVYHMIRD